MAIYHLSVKTVSRSAGRSATAAAAYRAGVEITDERTGEIHDYTRKGGVESAELVLPAGAPEWAADRAALWNAAEQAETRKNSTVAREFEIALPEELSPAERARLAHDFAREIVARHGCAADVAIHAPGKEGDNRNHHAHILLSTRRLGPEGFTEKTRELDDQKTGPQLVTEWRERFASLQNERLREAGIEARVDHRSLEAQGIDREPTKHLGPAATGYERRTGEPSRKRLDFAQEVADRLARAKEAGELERQGKALDSSILDLSGNLAEAKRVRADQVERERQAQALAERQRIERMTAAELREEMNRLRPPPVNEAVYADPAIKAAIAQREQLVGEYHQAQARERKAQDEAAAWREEHPLRAKAHDAGVFRAGYLVEREQAEADAKLHWLALAPKAEDAALKVRQLEQATRVKVEADQAPARIKVAELEVHYERKLVQEREHKRIELARATLEREFRGLAAKRAVKAHGWSDSGSQWKATPPLLRELVDEYNRRPKEQQERALKAWMQDPEKSQAIGALMQQRRDIERKNDRGLSR